MRSQNSGGAKGAMALSLPDLHRSNLILRLYSAACLAPLVVASIYFGSPWFDVFVVVAAIVMIWEWCRICGNGRFGRFGWASEAGILTALAIYYAGEPGLALAMLICVSALLATLWRGGGARDMIHRAVGIVLVGLFGLVMLWLRGDNQDGRDIVIWLICAVWFTDMGAYVAGKSIGGPRLAPRVSPNKTWAGLGGGVLAALLWSVFWTQRTDTHDPVLAAAYGVAITILAQLGDLTVSMVKRRHGVKDSSNLIPGHGGFLDRLDGMLLTAPATALALALAGMGTERPWI